MSKVKISYCTLCGGQVCEENEFCDHCGEHFSVWGDSLSPICFEHPRERFEPHEYYEWFETESA